MAGRDQDAALAAQLQRQEALAMQQSKLAASLKRDVVKALSVEDPAAQSAARAAAPLAALRAAAAEEVELNRRLGAKLELGEEELFVEALTLWFKAEFMSWVGNTLPCAACGGTAASSGMLQPSPEEQADGAARVEGFTCGGCGGVTRFPRYTSPRKLLETRRGRCGEWAHALLLFLRAEGLEARHVHDHLDHVWVEWRSRRLGRWMHVDPCEGAVDTPLIYEQGWGKRPALVVAVGAVGAADVTGRYVKDYSEALARRRDGGDTSLMTEELIEAQITALNRQLRAHASPEARKLLLTRDLADALQLGLTIGLKSPGGGAAGGAQLPGRLSGPAEWRAARGEDGAGSAAAGAHPPPPPPGTRYALVGPPPAPLAPLLAAARRVPGAAPGAACRASGGNGEGQGPRRLFDAAAATKWLDFGGGGAGGQAWAELRLPADAAPVTVCHYALVSGDDAPERDPAHILLECVPAGDKEGDGGEGDGDGDGGGGGGGGSGDAAEAWIVLDERRGVRFGARGQLLSFAVPPASRARSRRWRLRVLAARDPGAANSVQLAQWEMYASGPAPAGAAAGADAGDGCDCGQPVGAGGGGAGFLSESHIAALRRLGEAAEAPAAAAAAAAAAAPAAAAATAAAEARPPQPPPAGSDAAAAQLLRRVAANLADGPADPKFFGLRGDKVAPLLERPACVAALLEIGFRPVLLPPRPGAAAAAAAAGPGAGAGAAGGQQQQQGPERVGLVADHSEASESGSDGAAAARRGAAAVLAALGGGAGECST
ncbi:peptide-N(4)-(N-acetyl-beta-glucosaminyl) asparagine amidase [Raphidocelis subcapitata]|uniref:Peptide-N(4)-(N-acetyl-beta-glucosaminyl) asparagine amidase n=1 Tax=Raphidocelis subcapitata TaxID=307507 RepID=A0A2V0P1R1_9CHLO|nr:peptide-N(4)-(N-acetyl-beta-glucosaminyl) asparagine amidase [Raphidocelis subcapitata]|eukprot:GBF92862.1 peptide-N(4)-(N-acetyl-beta-glucosaminyl) asparagine amidase [Raphidocelis subcapitata]